MQPAFPRAQRPAAPQPTDAPAPLQVQPLAAVLADARAFYFDGVGNGDTTHWPCLTSSGRGSRNRVCSSGSGPERVYLVAVLHQEPELDDTVGGDPVGPGLERAI